MTPTREHLAGLELALKELGLEGYMTGAGCRDHISNLIAEAQSTYREFFQGLQCPYHPALLSV